MTRRIQTKGKPITRRAANGNTETGWLDMYTGEFILGTTEVPRPRASNPVDDLGATALLLQVLSTPNGRVAFTPGGIERQEAEEQKRMLKSQRLPKKIRDLPDTYRHIAHWDLMEEKLGIVKRTEYDDLFNTVTLPAGWVLEVSDHSMWSYMYDEYNRQRASVFYKGAFYDRRAEWSLNERFYTSVVYDTPTGGYAADTAHTYGVWDRHTDTFIWRGEFYDRSNKDWAFQDKQQADSVEWLEQHYPQWRDPFAYWYWV